MIEDETGVAVEETLDNDLSDDDEDQFSEGEVGYEDLADQDEVFLRALANTVNIIIYGIINVQCDQWCRYTDFCSVYRLQAKLGGYLVTSAILVQFYPIYM